MNLPLTPETQRRANASEQVERAASGEFTHSTLQVGTMASGQPITLPLLVAKGRAEGPVLWLNGAVHGDEINGILAISDFMAGLDCNNLAGTVVATPISNPTALDARRKRVPQDDQDLDQSFPGSDAGMLAQLLAHAVFDGIRQSADVVVNFHTMNPLFSSMPYAVYKDAGDGAPGESDILGAVSQFSPFVACRMSVTSASELPGNNAGALDYQCLKLGKLAFMIELGAGSQQQPDCIRSGVDGLQRLAGHLGMISANATKPGPIRRVTRRTHVFGHQGGFFRQHAAAGTTLPAGQPLGLIQDVAGNILETITFSQDVQVIGIRNDPVVHSGDRVGFVGLEWDDWHGQ
ncbi:M14 family metallopeptidase [Ruegeria profundi]|uniref:M14 family metallopeptidase n=1 Tax=Ruegeria profundi TaxID=1685378 RepID=UPI001CD1C8ED|nr:M14 family metallopeptidase [Ruegeria profundi]MCA0928039.1 M14 family metallopeptidase [Ruegeria profundi]